MLRHDFQHLKVLHGNALITGLTGHTGSFENLSGVRAGTYRTGSTQTVVLTVGGLSDTAESVATYDAFEAFTFRGSDDIYIVGSFEKVDRDDVAGFVSLIKSFELGQVSLGGYSGFFEVAHFGLGGVFLFLIEETHLYGFVSVSFNRLYLSNYAGTYFDNSAWNIFSLGTENGCHSDFFS